MQRRTFLFQSGILVPAIVLSPSSAFASSGTSKNLVFITGNVDRTADISSVVTDHSSNMQQLSADDVREISYSQNGFSIHLRNGETYTAGKVIFNADFKIDTHQLEVTIAGDDDEHRVGYNSGRNKQRPRPEFWSYTAKKFNEKNMQSFLQRKKHAFMCVS